MRSGSERDSVRWLVATPEIQRVIVYTSLHSWRSHWDAGVNRAIRCNPESCPYCADGEIALIRYVVGVFKPGDQRYLVELRKRHEEVNFQLKEAESDAVGRHMTIQRIGTAKNSPIEIKLGMKTAGEYWDIAGLVAVLGTRHT